MREKITKNLEIFDEKKHQFFVKLGLRAREWLKSHRDPQMGGLWEGEKKNRWENVSEHCLVVAARAEVLSEALGLSQSVRENIFAAAILHDFNKKNEILRVKQTNFSEQSFKESAKESSDKIRDKYNSEIASITSTVGHLSLGEIKNILQKEDLVENEIAKLILHYVDDYTIDSKWVEEADQSPSGQLQNDFDKRMDKNDGNDKYSQLKQAGYFKQQREVGNEVEARLQQLLKEKGLDIVAKKIPEEIDRLIKSKIEKLS